MLEILKITNFWRLILNIQEELQDEEYGFPYHYIPYWTNHDVQFLRAWPWSFRYLGRLFSVINELNEIDFNNLLDVGCGDGRLIHEINKNFAEKELIGIDYSAKAIDLAKALNPKIASSYQQINISTQKIGKPFDIITMIEVLEHINPDEIEVFLQGIADHLNETGTLIITVPSKLHPRLPKHYQHFSFESLNNTLKSHFRIKEKKFLNPSSKIMGIWIRLLGLDNDYFYITWPYLNKVFWNYYVSKQMYSEDESKSAGIMVICEKL